MVIKVVESKHWEEIKNIYQLGIDSGVATFETAPPKDFDQWLQKIDADNSFVILENEIVLGWASLSKVSTRSVYQGVGEVSIYIHPNAKRKGIGTKLYKHLEESAKSSGYWTIQAQLFTTNDSSKALFDALGFREVGIRKNIGKLGDEWIDNYLLEKSILKD
tara:strand:+ start:774 stop:1259 length:486 start_codon:yes stop_codon:yes gene_type:complete